MHVWCSLQHQVDVLNYHMMHLKHLLEAFYLELVCVPFAHHLAYHTHPLDKKWLSFLEHDSLLTWLFPTCAIRRGKSYSDIVWLLSFEMTCGIIQKQKTGHTILFLTSGRKTSQNHFKQVSLSIHALFDWSMVKAKHDFGWGWTFDLTCQCAWNFMSFSWICTNH